MPRRMDLNRWREDDQRPQTIIEHYEHTDGFCF